MTASPDPDDFEGDPPPALGTLYVVGIGPGLPHAMTRRAREVITTADCVIASDLYQTFLRRDGTLPPASAVDEAGVATREDGSTQELVRSTMGRQVDLARVAFDRVRAGEDVAHVSGGDPNVYGKSDLLFQVARSDGATDVPIEVVPGVTAALGAAARLGAPLSNDFCTISLSETWRAWSEIETKLRAAADSGFVVVLYNCWRDSERAIAVLREERADGVPAAILTDAGRGDAGRSDNGESVTLTTLGDLPGHAEDIGGMGTAILVGTTESTVWTNDYRDYLVTRRGDRDVEDF
jgi:precorrin-3B C17-methyltransferase